VLFEITPSLALSLLDYRSSGAMSIKMATAESIDCKITQRHAKSRLCSFVVSLRRQVADEEKLLESNPHPSPQRQ
jgi:hypothetical protein